MNESSAAVIAYHQRTKHRLDSYAKGPASLDWDEQPNPFRRFAGSPCIQLPQPGRDSESRFADLDTPDRIAAQAANLANLGLLLELSFGLSAWKQLGPDRWALRCNPSSGNLHPTEVYLLNVGHQALPSGLYHYHSHDHQLQQRCQFDSQAPSSIYIGLSSIYWREAWKYGERAYRYCQHDVGHALAALSYAAASLGWQVELLSEVGDAELAAWLGLDRQQDFVPGEGESPDLICGLNLTGQAMPAFDAAALTAVMQNARWFGGAEALCGRHFYQWPIIDEVAAQAKKPTTARERWQAQAQALPLPYRNPPASQLFRQRRSAQQFNAKAELLSLGAFQRIAAAMLPNGKAPFNAWNWPPQVHLLLFIHRVEGLEPGLYLLPRSAEAVPILKQACSQEFEWSKLDMAFEFYRLVTGNVRQAAKTLSCHQPIASDSAFSLGMLACFAENLEQEAWCYRRLFWECGLLGQILYLEAEAAGVRGTGIGCFFDDAVHGVLALQDNAWQSLYHFTVGQPLDDGRLQTLPAYQHLQAKNGNINE